MHVLNFIISPSPFGKGLDSPIIVEKGSVYFPAERPSISVSFVAGAFGWVCRSDFFQHQRQAERSSQDMRWGEWLNNAIKKSTMKIILTHMCVCAPHICRGSTDMWGTDVCDSFLLLWLSHFTIMELLLIWCGLLLFWCPVLLLVLN